MEHVPVMLEEVDRILDLKEGQVYADGTLGHAGHASYFLEKVGPKGKLVATDWDAAMLTVARERLGSLKGEVHLYNDDFSALAGCLSGLGLKANGVLLDLGLNSAQIEDSERGISFSKDGDLDMRMDNSRGEPASAWLNRASPVEIENVLFQHGDERWARQIAKQVVLRRKSLPLRTTNDLVECILAAVPAGARDKRINPATRSFQAIRIHINRELEVLEIALPQLAGQLADQGTLAVISFHSGEDRIVKQSFKALVGSGGYSDLAKKPLVPTDSEIRRNPRSRSAKLRAIRKLPQVA